MKKALTDRQNQVLDFIRSKINHDMIPPTIREVAGFFGFSSTATVRGHLLALSKKGYLKITRNKARALELLGEEPGLPIVGMVSCGKPRFAQEDIEGYLQLDKVFRSQKELFCLRATGESMCGAGIMEGDLLVVRRQSQAQSGEIVVALIGDDATVKFFRRKNNKCYLVPANKKFRTLLFTEFTSIVGKVISVVRKYV